MKIISGKYKGRNILGYNLDKTRPTQDRVKESVFATIQNNLEESVVLDLFAGSGNLGIEALSNGAKKAYFVDNQKEAIRVIENNLRSLNVNKENFSICHSDFEKALNLFEKDNIKFDLVFLDPPYQLEVISFILKKLVDSRLLSRNGIVVCEFEHVFKFNDLTVLHLWKEKKYGYKYVNFYFFSEEEVE